MNKQKLNDVSVQPYLAPTQDNTKNAGYHLLPELYANVFICAKKKSGKTCAIGKILEECASRHGTDRYGYFGPTSVFIIAGTVDKDPTYTAIIEKLAKKSISVTTRTDISSLPALITAVAEEVQGVRDSLEEEEEEECCDAYQNHLLGIAVEKKKKVIKPTLKIPKKLVKPAPRYIFVLDDMSGQLKNPALNKLLKENRHYLSKVIISSQYPNDLMPEARKQIDYWMLFGGHSQDKLLEMYRNADLHIDYPTFDALYQDATEPYNFLWIDSRNSEFRHNFSHSYHV
jgi:hypothetical protein